jgi:DNA invertase Pin-like site-specific DNA recombinase
MATEKLSPGVLPTKAKPKRVALYCRISTGDQHLETQLLDLREMAKQRGYEIVQEYRDIISGSKAKRPGLDQLLADVRRHHFDIVLVAAFDRVARSVRHFLEVLDELGHLNIEFVSLRENIDTGGPLGRAMIVIVSAIAELERSLIVERVRAGMRRAKLEGRRIGRAPLDIDRAQVVADRISGMSLTDVANKYQGTHKTLFPGKLWSGIVFALFASRLSGVDGFKIHFRVPHHSAAANPAERPPVTPRIIISDQEPFDRHSQHRSAVMHVHRSRRVCYRLILILVNQRDAFWIVNLNYRRATSRNRFGRGEKHGDLSPTLTDSDHQVVVFRMPVKRGDKIAIPASGKIRHSN